MKKERLTKEDKIILKKQRLGFNFPIFFIILTGLGLWGFYIYYFRENYFENHHRFYILDLSVIILVGVVLIGIYITFEIENILGYKFVLIGYIDAKKSTYDEGMSYYFFIREKKITVSKKYYEKYKRGQKVRIELTPLSKQTIRVLSLS